MSFFSEEKASELRELFFESAQELLQALNEEGLELEKRPGDTEVVRGVRRTVHTLKGDSAACGYRELSELAHELEDVLTPELAKRSNGSLAEVVLAAADTFEAMLTAYRGSKQPPTGNELRVQIHRLTRPETQQVTQPFEPKFEWSEYERVAIADAAGRGQSVYHVALGIDPGCALRAAAVQLTRNVLLEVGTVLALRPEDNAAEVSLIEAALASDRGKDWIARKCHIPAVVSRVLVETAAAAPAPAESSARAEEAPPAAPGATSLSGAAENLLRVDAERIDAVLNLVGELIVGKSMLHQSMTEFDRRFPKDALRGKFADALAFQARVLNDLQKSVMKIRMVPVEQLFRRFPRIVRDVARAANKEVELVIGGEDTDLDKSILDLLAEPLAHLVRNAVDHGIESAEERRAAGKTARGTVRLNAFHQGNQVIVEIGDDGRGIDCSKVVAKAIERGVITADEAARLTEAEGLNLIFHSGLSTAEQVTEISGRGVGMDVVKSVLDRLKATISIETKPGQGTRFFLKVPLTLAIIKALLFRVSEKLYAVPLASVVEITRAVEAEIHRVDDHEVIQLRDQVLTLVRLQKLSRQESAGAERKLFIVVIAFADRKFGLVVDRLVGEEELVIKAMDDHLVATDLVSGASILGDGTVVLILNVSAVVDRLARSQPEGVRA
ncbi:MAG: chemotaxis protein CheA [Terriglobales bacterium]